MKLMAHLKMPFSSDDSGHNESTSRKRRTLKPELNTLPSDTKEICQQRNRHLPVSQLGYQAVGGQNRNKGNVFRLGCEA